MKNSEFREMLEKSRSLGKYGRQTALKELPRFLRAVGRRNVQGELPYAVLLCRAEGLRRAAMQQLPDLGGDAHAQSAAEELERLLKLTGKERSEERKQLAPRYTARKHTL